MNKIQNNYLEVKAAYDKAAKEADIYVENEISKYGEIDENKEVEIETMADKKYQITKLNGLLRKCENELLSWGYDFMLKVINEEQMEKLSITKNSKSIGVRNEMIKLFLIIDESVS